MKKALKWTGLLLLALVVLVALFLLVTSLITSYRNAHYTKFATPGGDIEKHFTAMGSYEVSYFEAETGDDAIKKYGVWYPSSMAYDKEAYPMVIMANGTGVKASAYQEVFRHLASWGFIVAGNEDEFSWNGLSTSKTLGYMLQLHDTPGSVFYQRIDTDHIGVAGHSQGGVGAINAVTNQPNGDRYAAMWTASTTFHGLAQLLNWPYDVRKVTIPYMMVAGTKPGDAGNGSDFAGIAPLWSLQENFEAIPAGTPKVMARQKEMDHGDMLRSADGYMTAWFMYYLKGDIVAGSAFFGALAELRSNPNWQDVSVTE